MTRTPNPEQGDEAYDFSDNALMDLAEDGLGNHRQRQRGQLGTRLDPEWKEAAWNGGGDRYHAALDARTSRGSEAAVRIDARPATDDDVGTVTCRLCGKTWTTTPEQDALLADAPRARRHPTTHSQPADE